MPIGLQELVEEIEPVNTVLIFGAGASVPSNAPSVAHLISRIASEFKIDPDGLTLSEISGLAERKRNRRDLITLIRSEFKEVRAKGSILNLPLYRWKSIFSTNYDELVESAYLKANMPLTVYSSNFDFSAASANDATKLLKIHGTISKDAVDGHMSRMILTDHDYDLTQEYREILYGRLAQDLTAGTRVVIIGQSLADPDLKEVVQRAITINQKVNAGGRIMLLLYSPDQNRASLFEARGLRVAFGGLDQFFAALSKKAPDLPNSTSGVDLIDLRPELRPVTTIVAHETDVKQANVSAIFNGWPASYADIVKGFTFERTISSSVWDFARADSTLCSVILGASGVGKTSAARQVMLKAQNSGFLAWEHRGDFKLNADYWLTVAEQLGKLSKQGILLIDDAHAQLFAINDLVDRLVAANLGTLKLLLVSTRNHWGPRVKTPNIYSKGKEFILSRLNNEEIDRLLTLVETVSEMRALVEAGFGGFSRYEQRRRLMDRCENDMFVCLKNIFATEKFDDIILREFASLNQTEQEIYRYVAAMEFAGVRVHRQLVIRLLGISATNIASTLAALADIVNEYSVNAREGIYGWRVRHNVIAGIISRYKFADIDAITSLFGKVIDQISPTYEVEIRTIIELCNVESGLAVIPDKRVQNNLLRRMMSIAPGERVPRHRLIRNLIDIGEFEKAESEIRIFEKDFRRDGPVVRYRILLMIARATLAPDLLLEDRKVILEQAREVAASAAERFEANKAVLGAYCDLGVETFKLTGSHAVYDDAMKSLKKAEARLGDPDVTKMIIKYQRRISQPGAHSAQADEESE